MANLPSAVKRTKQNEKRRARNRARKSVVKSVTRKLTDVIGKGDVAVATEQFKTVTKVLDQSAAKGTLHKNTVARRKSRLAKRINELAAKKS